MDNAQVPLRDRSSDIGQWLGTGIDGNGRERAPEKVQENVLFDIGANALKPDDDQSGDRNPATLGDTLWQFIDTIPAFVWCASPDGSIEFLNHQGLAYTGFSLKQVRQWSWQETNIIHPDDMQRLTEEWAAVVTSGQECDIQARMRRFDGTYRWFLFRVAPVRDSSGRLIRWVGVDVEIDELRRAEEKLRQSERELQELIDAIPQQVFVFDSDWNPLFANRRELEYTGLTPQEAQSKDTVARVFHPDDLRTLEALRERMRKECAPFEMEARIRGRDGQYRWFLIRDNPLQDEHGRVLRWYGTRTDIEDRKRAEEALRRSESYLAEGQRLAHMGGWTFSPLGFFEYWSDELFRIYGFEPAKGPPTLEEYLACIHPQVREFMARTIERMLAEHSGCDVKKRIVRPDGEVRYIRWVGVPVFNNGVFTEIVGTAMDVTEEERLTHELQRREAYLAKAQKLSHAGSFGWIVLKDEISWSDETFRIFEYDRATKPTLDGIFQRVHPDDLDLVQQVIERASSGGTSFDVEHRLLLPDGTVKHLRVVADAMMGCSECVEFVGAVTDITEQTQARADLEQAFEEIKKLKDQLYKENLALKEEIDQTSMFEEIVGSSAALRRVLGHVARVAPTDSTVLITGETGTGKELVARAVHKRSGRANRAFVSVNCAAIPSSLIASELFGYEKGAFTGASQRRLGRFELADGGTLFLDEVGELPPETQITLLRVLQERAFERVGGNQLISVDVRVLAATNRDLRAAAEAGTFRSDLFYRLNVFPIHMPPLRERVDDIPLLVEYLTQRYASKIGRKIGSIKKRTLELLQAYDWPGNIRELQNLLERAVILCDGDTLVIDETWLQRESPSPSAQHKSLARANLNQEKEPIEAALAECHGRVSGPDGAAAKVGIPRSTLESKIRSLQIDKHRFKSR